MNPRKLRQDANYYNLLSLGNGRLVYHDGADLCIATNPRLDYDRGSVPVTPMHQEDGSTIYLSGERTGTFHFITHGSGNFNVFNPDTFGLVKQIQASDMEKVIAVTASYIMYQSSQGSIVTVSYVGDEFRGEAMIHESRVDGSRASVFRVLDAGGGIVTNNMGYMIFFVQDIFEAPIVNQDQEGNEVSEPSDAEPITVGAIATIDNEKTYLLARLNPDRFLTMPKELIDDSN